MLKEDRRRAGYKNQRTLAEAAKVSLRTVAKIEVGDPHVGEAVHDVAAVLGWEPGSVDRVLAGGEPTRRGDRPAAPVSALAQVAKLDPARRAALEAYAQFLMDQMTEQHGAGRRSEP